MNHPVELSYGPPGEAGVKHLQYMSGLADADYVASGFKGLARAAAIAALATWGYAYTVGDEPLRRKAQGAAVAAFVVGLLVR